MSNVNTVSISGNLTRDPELRQSASGVSFLNFGIAVNDRRKNPQTGEYEDYANFFDCTAIGKRAEGLSTFLAKGMKVAIDGKLQWRQWEADDGSKRTAVSIVVNEIDVMSRKDGENRSSSSSSSQQGGGMEDDIPF